MAEGKINANLRISDGTNDYKTLKELCTDVCTAYMSGREYITRNSNISQSLYEITLGTIKTNNPNIFELQGRYLKVKKTMKVLISAQIVVWNPPTTSDEFDVNIYVNRNNAWKLIAKVYSSNKFTSGLISHYISPNIVELEENDLLALGFLTFDSSSYHILGDNMTTFLTIQEI